ncbi:hypothetical protein [Paenibacillus alkalitolerans]|uniref:hypothetical protein n=1 Tax=Paenibacillus alkalitolerans TaxID=2799335 RepID=UPI0018F40F67|nr:hypothetical protein [Paenibacillus alkalitolerans]
MLKKLLLLWLFAILVGGCGFADDKEAEPDSSQTETVGTQPLSEKTELAAADGVTLYGGKEEGGVFRVITIKTGNTEKSFSWSTVTNESYFPDLKLIDTDQDGNDEIVIIVTKGYGTGVYDQEIHVLNEEDLSEMPVESAIEFINGSAKSEIVKAYGKMKVTLDISGEKFEQSYEESFAAVWHDKVGFGSIVRYQLEDNKIVAVIPGNISPAGFVVDVKLEYGADLKVEHVEIVEI